MDKDWFNRSLRHLVFKPESKATESHLLIGTIEDTADVVGLWMKEIETTRLRQDGASIRLRVLIPWRYVISCALTDEGDPVAVGFGGQDVTVLK